MVEALRRAGLREVKVEQRFACFDGTSKEGVTRRFGVFGLNLSARR